jgi:serine/threonine-protein kinase HipA
MTRKLPRFMPVINAAGIERFDSVAGMRAPIHTLAGALNIDFQAPTASYQTLLRTTRAMTLNEVEVRKAYERCVFNVVFNNRDDHSKNFSFRMDESLSWALAPCYDLSYCPGPGGQRRMDVEGEGLHPARKHLLQLARSNGIDPHWAQEAIERIVAVALRFGTVASDSPIRKATRAEIAAAIARNCDRMA